MSTILTVMDPGKGRGTQLLAPPVLSTNSDKLRWRKNVFCCAATLRACADGGYGREKEMFAVLGVHLYRSLPLLRQQLIEKNIATGDVTLNPSDSVYSNDGMEDIDNMINIVTKDSASDSTKRLAKLCQNATTCVRSRREPMSTSIERPLLPAQTYLNQKNAAHASAESQNLATIFLLNASLSQETFLSVMASLVSATKTVSSQENERILMSKDRNATLIKLLLKLSESSNV